MSINDLSKAEAMFRAVSDKTRLRIISLLGTGEQSVCHLAEALELAQPTASRHLAYLKRTRLVVARPEANRMYYRLAQPEDEFHKKLLEALQHHFDEVQQFVLDTQRLQSARRT